MEFKTGKSASRWQMSKSINDIFHSFDFRQDTTCEIQSNFVAGAMRVEANLLGTFVVITLFIFDDKFLKETKLRQRSTSQTRYWMQIFEVIFMARITFTPFVRNIHNQNDLDLMNG